VKDEIGRGSEEAGFAPSEERSRVNGIATAAFGESTFNHCALATRRILYNFAQLVVKIRTIPLNLIFFHGCRKPDLTPKPCDWIIHSQTVGGPRSRV